MININDYNREDLIASCLMEAAQVMNESAGKNGITRKVLSQRAEKTGSSVDKYISDSYNNIKGDRKFASKNASAIEATKRRNADVRNGQIYKHYGYPSDYIAKTGNEIDEKLSAAEAKNATKTSSIDSKINSRQSGEFKRLQDEKKDKKEKDKIAEVGRTLERNDKRWEEYYNNSPRAKRIRGYKKKYGKPMGESVEEHIAFADALLDLLDE